eukprot:NODE_2168_length_1184_cov_49.177974_g1798_i0.p1 GENE.NODE_2168_length_1184_cov_49.177974_g1798_i0~~NODE_2168_length_1184_cov_49.177974_g1798_i0.p1  ORF type:complete len:359 (+),score=102.75 NODE_2168_length_1184_cov_49.177974_g1798_i0:35-1111(+)
MNHLCAKEIGHILAVFDDLLLDLDILALIPNRIQELPVDVEEGARDVLAQYAEAEARLEAGFHQEEAVLSHKNATRALVDRLREMSWVRQVQNQVEASPSVFSFHEVIKTLQDLAAEKLTTTVEEDTIKAQILRDTVTREQTASADVKALKREVQAESMARKTEVARRDESIQKLLEEYKQVQDEAHNWEVDFDRNMSQQARTQAETFASQEEMLQKQIASLAEELRKAEERNAKEETAARNERRRREQFLDGLLQQYDREMIEKTDDLETLQTDLKKDGTRMEALEKDLKVLDDEYEAAEKAARIEATRKAHYQALLQQQEEHSKLIQAFFRGYWVRSQARKATKKRRPSSKKSKRK